MRKEPITFVFALVVSGLLLFTGGEEETGRVRSRGQGPPARDLEAGSIEVAYLGDEGAAWSRTLDNIYRAPRETEPLAPVELLPPPLPPLPSPGLPLVPRVGGALQRTLRHPHVPDASIDTSTPSTVNFGAEPEDLGPDGNPEGGEPETDPLDEVDVPGELSVADRLRLSVREALLREEAAQRSKQDRLERLKALDRIVYTSQGGGVASGATVYGRIEPVKEGDDIYELKRRFDAIVASDLSEEEQARQKREIRFVWMEDRGPDRSPRRAVLEASKLEQIEFADTAKNRFELARRALPITDVDGHVALARDAFQAMEDALVAKHLEGFRVRKELTAEGMALLSDCHRRRLDYGAELSVLEDAVAAHPADLSLNARLGRLQARLGLLPRARAAFERALATEPGHAPSRLGLGEVLLAQGEVTEALRHLREARNGRGLSKPDTVLVLNLLGEAHLLAGDADAAGRQFGVAKETDPANVRALAGEIVVAFLKQGAGAAGTLAERARNAHPLNGRLAYLQGLSQLSRGEYGAGRATLELALGLDPLLSAEIHVARSWLFEKAGNFDAALGAAGEALSADPTSLAALKQRARCRFLTQDLEGARADYLEALGRDPEDVDLLVALGDVAFQADDPEAAGRFYERAAAVEADFPDLFSRRLITAVRNSDRGLVEDFLRQVNAAMERDPRIQASLAFHRYVLKGAAQECLQRLRQILAREEGEEVLRSWAATQQEEIEANLAKERWRDDFERSGSSLLRGWERAVGNGINVALSEGRVAFAGRQNKGSMAPTALYQVRNGRQFVSFAIDLDMTPKPGVWQGIGLIAFNRTPRPPAPYPGMQERDGNRIAFHGGQVALSPDGKLRFRYLERGEMSEWQDLDVPYAGGPVRLGLEVLDHNASTYTLTVDRRAAATLEIPGLGRHPRELELQAFVQADLDKTIETFAVDNAEIVTSKR